MDSKKIGILERALIREKQARKEAESILEDKAFKLYDLTNKLKESNNVLESLLAKKNFELKGVFKNILDAYCLIDMYGNVLEMNDATFELLGCKSKDESINLSDFVYAPDVQATMEAFRKIRKESTLKNFNVRIETNENIIKYLQINASLIFNDKGKPIAIQGIARDITDEKRLQQKRIESESRLKVLIKNLDSGILLEDENRNIVLINDKFCNLFEIPVASSLLVGQNCVNAIEDSKKLFLDSEGFVERVNALIKNKEEELSEVIEMANGKILQRDYIPIFNDNLYKGHLWSYKDITGEKEIQNNLIESENRLKNLILNLDSGIFLEDENRVALLANKSLCEQFYMPGPPESYTGKDCSNGAEESKALFIEPEKFVNRYNEIISNREPVIREELKMKDGKILERNYVPIFKNGIFRGHLWSFNDVTLERNYNKNLEAEKQKYSSIIANMNLGLVEVDSNNVIVMVNQSFINLIGYTEEELIGRPAIDLLIPESQQGHVEKIAEMTKNGNSGSHEFQMKTKKGELLSLLVSSAPNYNKQSKVIGSIGVILDITKTKNLQEQREELLKNLEISNNELQEYAHIVSHDLKSPLRSIFALIEWLKEDNQEKLNRSSLQNIELIEATLEKMERLITDILKYSSVTAEEIVMQEIDLNAVIENLKRILYFPEHINFKILRPLPFIYGDETRMQQLFQNLISNAIQYIDKDHGIIEIDYVDKGTYYQFSIYDNGIGIAKEQHGKIFKIFQVLSDTKESSGIGLAIVKKIVDLYKGDIWLKSTLGEGTTFYFTLQKNKNGIL
ncbi:PAS/PAC sensor signal transduction histidine kinase [Ulvibacter sp. MAR_2010_11]|uniref:PAS domain S-box protein n=1 Tax=Ulvibacter sp. MAR_2010_11 TaxID=1250229 RepID=UPI000C2BF909|nr:PAS domain S-box protein [Ulvibacter sp. MAR_2010_11]PKA82615.1 PAS/PAC sensor signal transduction histidine kinase [Ulvibacter sp. MAR_2010_11]